MTRKQRVDRWCIGACIAMTAIVMGASAAAAAPLLATSRLQPINGSDVRARIFLTNEENGRIKALGVATGMDPNTTYLSLVYAAGSEPNGPTPCVGRLNIIGQWFVKSDGSASLSGELAVWPVNVRAISVRSMRVVGVLPDGPRGSIGQAELTLEACGRPRVLVRE